MSEYAGYNIKFLIYFEAENAEDASKVATEIWNSIRKTKHVIDSEPLTPPESNEDDV